MLLFEMISWAILGLVMAVARFFFSPDSPHRGMVFVGSVVAALLLGALGRGFSPAEPSEYSPLGLLFAGVGALSFLLIDWMATRRWPRLRA